MIYKQENPQRVATRLGDIGNTRFNYSMRAAKINPCFNCTNRKTECHSDCLDYKSWCDSEEEAKRLLFKQKHDKAMMDNYVIKKVEAERKRKRVQM